MAQALKQEEPAPAPIESKAQLVDYFEAGCKPEGRWRVGTEHESIGYNAETGRPVPYETIRALLESIAQEGWAPVYERENIVALTRDGASITLEPAGAVELSGKPLDTLHVCHSELRSYHAVLARNAAKLKMRFFNIGFNPLHTVDEVPRMPKERYQIMRDHWPEKGPLGLQMMTQSCTVQANLDYASEADMVKKMRVALALQPIVTALFANAPFKEGGEAGVLSYRAHTWRDVDAHRCGIWAEVFDEGFGFEKYVDHALSVPLVFLTRGGTNAIVPQEQACDFRALMDGKLNGFDGERATMADWETHLSLLFPDVRLKRYLEMRGADAGPLSMLVALPALWVGLLYDTDALDQVWELVKDWTFEDVHGLRHAVPEQALATPFQKGTVKKVAKTVVAIASDGLKRRKRRSGLYDDESVYLDPLRDILEHGKTLAEQHLDSFNGPWQKDLHQHLPEISHAEAPAF